MFCRARTRRWASLFALVWFATQASRAAAQLEPHEALKVLEAREDLEVTLFASEPMITNPTAIDVDAYGRVWVCEGQWYRGAAKDPPADQIKVLEDTDGDGRADKVTVFARGLLVPMGICVAGSRVYVAETPYIWVFEDRDGDLQADGPPRALLSGFKGRNHDHGVHGLVLGPDHKLYMTVGDKGFDVTGPDGRRIQYPWGAMIRCELDGTQLEAFAVNFRNPYELAIDSFGNVWCSDNDRDGLRSVRICWILEGGNYGWYGQPVMIRNPDGSYDPRHHWRVFRLGIVPYVLITGFGSPCGMTFYEGDLLPRDLRGALLHADAGPRVVRAYRPTPAGAGFRASVQTILRTRQDPYFRPVDVCVGPSGEVYVADWYDHMVGGHAYNNPHQGRIYLIRPKQRRERSRSTAETIGNVEDALQALASPNLATQYLARQWLIDLGPEAVPALVRFAQKGPAFLTARALWVLDRLGPEGRREVLRYLSHDDPRLRTQAVRILRRHGPAFADHFLPLAADESPQVRREVLLALSQLPPAKARKALVELVRRWDGRDRYYLEAIGIAASKEESLPRQLLRTFVEQKDRWGRREVALIRLLRGEKAGPELAHAIRSGRVTRDGAIAALEAFIYSTDQQAGVVLLTIAADETYPVEVRAQALNALRLGISQHWRPLRTHAAFRKAWEQALRDDNLAPIACLLIEAARVAEAARSLATVASDPDRPEAVRLATLKALVSVAPRQAPAVLVPLVKDSPRLRDAAVDGLVQLRQFEPLRSMLQDRSLPLPLRQAIARRMMRNSEAALWLLEALKDDSFEAAIRREIINAGLSHPNVNVQALYQPLVPASERPKTVAEAVKPEDVLQLEGNPERGRQLFESAGTAPCIQCHMVRGRGGDVGPDLSQIGRKYDRAALLEAILYPSRAIAPEFQPYVVLTVDGRVHVGFLREQTPERVVLHTAEGELISLARKQVELIRPQQTSIMPELAANTLTTQDLADLVAYLSTLREDTQTITGWWAVGPFGYSDDAGFDHVYAPEVAPGRIDLDKTYRGVQGKEVTWRPIGTMLFQGRQGIDAHRLAQQVGARTNRIVWYFAVGIASESEQDATLLFGSDDGIKVWLNGQLVHSKHEHRPARYAEDQVRVRLRRGLNVLLVKLEQQLGGSGLLAAIATESRVQFVPPRGSANQEAQR